MSETTRVVIVNAEEFGLRESADFLEQHWDECDPAYLSAVAASMRQAADSLAAHAQAVQRLTEELKLAESAMSSLAAEANTERDRADYWKFECERVLAELTGGQPTMKVGLRPRPEGST